MRYDIICKGIFLSRPNRFIAHVLLLADGDRAEKEVVCHVKNTGRCRELLTAGAAVLVQFHPDAAACGRKTEYSLIGVFKERDGEMLLINMDSQAPNQVAAEWLGKMAGAPGLCVGNGLTAGAAAGGRGISPSAIRNIRREVTYGQSRFDLAFELVLESSFPSAGGNGETSIIRPAFMEVKGVTLEENGIAMFPDAPTERGVKHIMELAKAVEDGYEAYILFVIQMKGVHTFTPNRKTHPQFGDALKAACEAGVHVLARDCLVTENSLEIDEAVDVKL